MREEGEVIDTGIRLSKVTVRWGLLAIIPGILGFLAATHAPDELRFKEILLITSVSLSAAALCMVVGGLLVWLAFLYDRARTRREG